MQADFPATPLLDRCLTRRLGAIFSWLLLKAATPQADRTSRGGELG
jgi:hypothetical protein